ncbi:MAG: DUF4097 family beta strand repeat-containing protein [Candidatus Acidiferrales bacterium]
MPSPPERGSHTRKAFATLATSAALASLLLAGCSSRSSAEGTFDKTFTVNGPIHLELTSGSGDAHVSTGPAGQVTIHGEIQVKSWSEEGGQRLVHELESNPPVSQEGNLIRVSGAGQRPHDVSIDYSIVVPAEAEIHATTGSGDLDVDGVKGPATFTSGSGGITASNIAGDVQAVAGSGAIELNNIQGQVQATAGSGDVTLNSVHGETRLHTGSGDQEISSPGDALECSTGSGDVTVKGASADLRVRTSSGDVTVDGNPGNSNYWDIHTSSGDVVLQVPPNASFRLYARSSSSDIDAEIPIMMEGTAMKHELRARIGDGKARVEVQTSSGSISLK